MSYTDAENFMRAKDMSFFFETSALDGQNIQMVNIFKSKLIIDLENRHLMRQQK